MRKYGFYGILVVASNVFFIGYSDAQKSQKRGFFSKPDAEVQADADFFADVSTVVGQKLNGFLELQGSKRNLPIVIPLRNGLAEDEIPGGDYSVVTHVYDNNVPIIVDIRSMNIRSGELNTLSLSVLEGATGERSLSSFDQDYDQVLDKVEVEQKTDPRNATSTPFTKTYEWDNQLKSNKAGWVKGDLQTHSTYGIGKESVEALIRRAEKTGIDFLAITDRNTLDSTSDPYFKSDSMVLIPAMEWGNDEKGIALLYGPRTFPQVPKSNEEAQYKMIRLQVEGGIFGIAHPCFPITSWNWPIQYPNAVQVWCMNWREIPPMRLAQVAEPFKGFTTIIDKEKNREVIRWKHAMARAANNQMLSSNGQSSLYYDLELSRGLRASAIGGSNSANPKRPIGAPLTYIFVREKSLNGILEGLRNGWTYITKDKNGPTIDWYADIFDDGIWDITIGGAIPLNQDTRFQVKIKNANGKRFEILLNGLPIRSTIITSNDWDYTYVQNPDSYAVYRIRILDQPEEELPPGYGLRDMLLLTSPIYAQGVISDTANTNDEGWVQIENEWVDPEVLHEHIRELNRLTN
jgi:hypothetical protein